MKLASFSPLALAIASQAANLYPLPPARELELAKKPYQWALVAADPRGSVTFMAATGADELVQFKGPHFDPTAKEWLDTWDIRSASDIGFASDITGLAWSGSLFMAVGNGKPDQGGASPTPNYAVSTDGLRWTTYQGTDPGGVGSLAFGGGSWIGTGSTTSGSGQDLGMVQYSRDNGATWKTVTIPSCESIKMAKWNGSTWMAFGETRTGAEGGVIVETFVYTSPDGVAWTLRSTPRNVILESLVGGHGLWVAVGQTYFRASETGKRHPLIMSSSDGVSWTDVSPINESLGGYLADIDTTLHGFVTVGPSQTFHSYDGTTWEPLYANPSARFACVKTFVVGGYRTHVYMTADTGNAFEDTLEEESPTASMRELVRTANAGWKVVGNQLHTPSPAGSTIEVSIVGMDGRVERSFSSQVEVGGGVTLPAFRGMRMMNATSNSGERIRFKVVRP